LPREPNASGDDDALLVAATRRGDRSAFGHLYSRYARMVHGILLAHAPRTEVEDLAQDVFLLAWRHIAKLRDAELFGNWLARIARNRAREFFRHPLAGEEVRQEAVTIDPPAMEAARALAAIRRLPDAYRETLVLRLVEGMTGPEIARRTGLTAGSVRVNLHRGMKLLRDQLEGGERHE
jgi:RNA polymerase sigma-70 factor (ECF subfamily)